MGLSASMPAFDRSLSEQDIDSVLAYIKTVGQAEGRVNRYPDSGLFDGW